VCSSDLPKTPKPLVETFKFNLQIRQIAKQLPSGSTSLAWLP
jgi:hypothetical protein